MGMRRSTPHPITVLPTDETLPDTVLDGTKATIGNTAAAIGTGEITKGILVRVDDLGGGTFVKFGNSTSQNLIVSAINTYIFIDWANNLSLIYAKTDGTNAGISWNGA